MHPKHEIGARRQPKRATLQGGRRWVLVRIPLGEHVFGCNL